MLFTLQVLLLIFSAVCNNEGPNTVLPATFLSTHYRRGAPGRTVLVVPVSAALTPFPGPERKQCAPLPSCRPGNGTRAAASVGLGALVYHGGHVGAATDPSSGLRASAPGHMCPRDSHKTSWQGLCEDTHHNIARRARVQV